MGNLFWKESMIFCPAQAVVSHIKYEDMHKKAGDERRPVKRRAPVPKDLPPPIYNEVVDRFLECFVKDGYWIRKGEDTLLLLAGNHLQKPHEDPVPEEIPTRYWMHQFQKYGL